MSQSKPKALTFYLYIAIHIAAIVSLFFVPFSWDKLLLFGVSYFFMMFFITGGYHRYFSHRAYKLDRIPQFCMAFLCMMSGQKGILWWAATHRDHHLYSDTELDVHSPVQKGFWYSHILWIFNEDTMHYNPKKIQDFGRFPELRWLDKYDWVPTLIYASVVFTLGGLISNHGFWSGAFQALIYGYACVLLTCYQVSYTINSLAHVYGKKRFDTGDESRNNWFLAILTLGEGWHNNHHYCKSSVRQGIKWYEIDMTFYLLYLLSLVGIVKDMRPFREENTKGIVVGAKTEELVAQPIE